MKINQKRIEKITGRVELDYYHNMSAADFRIVYKCPYYEVGIEKNPLIYYIPAESITAIEKFFPANVREILEIGAKCKIIDYENNSWIVKFEQIDLKTLRAKHRRILDYTEYWKGEKFKN